MTTEKQIYVVTAVGWITEFEFDTKEEMEDYAEQWDMQEYRYHTETKVTRG